MSAPVGRVVGLYMDTLRTVAEQDVITTPSGRAYRVVGVRRQERGIHEGRWHLRALVIDPTTIQDGDEVIPLVWYRR